MKTLILAALAALFAVPAFAQQAPCFPRDRIVAEITNRYGEATVALGVTGDGNAVFEFWGNRESVSWTLTRTTPDGVTCALADGMAWEAPKPVVPGEDS